MFLQVENNAFPHPQGPLVHLCNPRSVPHVSHRSHSHLPSQVSQRPGSPSSHLPRQLGHTGPRCSTASRSPSLRLCSPLVRTFSFSSLSHLDPRLPRHDMENESFQHAALVLCRTDRDHRTMFPHSHRHMRMLYLGLVSHGL